ncbi:hypothetical protein [Aureimonas sp. SK2]|uniref:hypothetical protein n=1 Tax=Aureimonas sp. SK2 TaxID=3015992 RepID=UPI002444255D|nr:hypothetical protein [Aureimonas sp. SK2]
MTERPDARRVAPVCTMAIFGAAGHRSEPNVAPDSRGETCAALKLHVDTPRWSSVPFSPRSGERMTAHRPHVAIAFKPASHPLFQEANASAPAVNRLIQQVDGKKGIRTKFRRKAPGPGMPLAPVVEIYPAGSAGIARSDGLPARAGRRWTSLRSDPDARVGASSPLERTA